MPGTTVQSGGSFHAYINTEGVYCNSLKIGEVSLNPGEDSDNETFIQQGDEFFKVFPNPTNGGFSLELYGVDETVELKVEMFGILGERVFNAELQGQRKYDLTLEGKPIGVYFIRVVSGKLAGAGKIIKQ